MATSNRTANSPKPNVVTLNPTPSSSSSSNPTQQATACLQGCAVGIRSFLDNLYKGNKSSGSGTGGNDGAGGGAGQSRSNSKNRKTQTNGGTKETQISEDAPPDGQTMNERLLESRKRYFATTVKRDSSSPMLKRNASSGNALQSGNGSNGSPQMGTIAPGGFDSEGGNQPPGTSGFWNQSQIDNMKSQMSYGGVPTNGPNSMTGLTSKGPNAISAISENSGMNYSQAELEDPNSNIAIQTLLLQMNPSRKMEEFYETPKGKLGEGGFGSVMKVKHRASGMERAVKVLPRTKKNIDLLSTELSVLLQLDHPNICKCFEWFEEKSTLYIVTELCTGGELVELLHKRAAKEKAAKEKAKERRRSITASTNTNVGTSSITASQATGNQDITPAATPASATAKKSPPAPPTLIGAVNAGPGSNKPTPRTLDVPQQKPVAKEMTENSSASLSHVCAQILQAVNYCHKLYVVHRDLKLENCLLKDDSSDALVKVIDFGLAAIKEDDEQFSASLGTPFFVAPEVIDKSTTYDEKCDLWSCGVIFYVLLTGQHPFFTLDCKKGFNKLFQRVRNEPPHAKPLDRIRPDAKELILQLLRKDPADRPSAEQALQSRFIQTAQDEYHIRMTKTSPDVFADQHTIYENMLEFSKFDKFSKVIMTMAAHQAHARELGRMQKVFMEVDEDKSGFISKEELWKALTENLEQKMTEEEFEVLFDALDADRTGRITYTEWLTATLEKGLLAEEATIKRAFQFFDLDGSGEISADELRTILGEEDALRAMKIADINESGSITEEEFAIFVRETVAKNLQADKQGRKGSK